MAIRFLHITRDEKFIDSLIKNFERDERTVNRYVIPDKKKAQLRYIKQKSRVEVLTYRELHTLLKKGEYDVVYFHAIPDGTWVVIDWIPKGKTIVWWSWGYDIYHSRIPNLPSLIELPYFKEETRRYVEQHVTKERKSIISFLKGKYIGWRRKVNIARIDYYIPVILIEYDYMCKIKGFRAQLFSNPRTILDFHLELNPTEQGEKKGIIIGNSSYPTNNQIDIWRQLNVLHLKNTKIVFPLNYGDTDYRNFLIENIHSEENEIIILKDFIPFDEYNKLIDSCGFAILGVIRQQADGTVSLCMRHGIKLFLYEDSLMYKNLIKCGYIVYSIDKMTSSDFQTVLTEEQAVHNFNTWMNIKRQEGVLYDKVIEGLYNKTEKCV